MNMENEGGANELWEAVGKRRQLLRSRRPAASWNAAQTNAVCLLQVCQKVAASTAQNRLRGICRKFIMRATTIHYAEHEPKIGETAANVLWGLHKPLPPSSCLCQVDCSCCSW